MNPLTFKILNKGNIDEMLPLVLQLNKEYKEASMIEYLNEMFDYDTLSIQLINQTAMENSLKKKFVNSVGAEPINLLS